MSVCWGVYYILSVLHPSPSGPFIKYLCMPASNKLSQNSNTCPCFFLPESLAWDAGDWFAYSGETEVPENMPSFEGNPEWMID